VKAIDQPSAPSTPRPGRDQWTGPLEDELRSLMRTNLRKFERRRIRLAGDRRRAAVAIALVDADSNPAVLMIKRVNKGRHAGQWALPGGVTEPGERAAQAALREAFEEVGLQHAEVAGPLDDLLTGSGFIITPIVMFAAKGVRLRRNADEVHSLHRVRLARLVATGMPRWVRDDEGRELLQYPLRHDMVVHAPTGAILWQFAEVALRGRATRVANLTQPAFAMH
jgi:8-oxo-dGTP pyrophosphatase MutT (NUDIX family)